MRARSSCAASGSSARTAASARTHPDHTAGASRLRDAGATTSPRRSTVAPWISAAGRGAHVPRTSRARQILRDATPSVPQRRTPGRGRRRVDGFSIPPLPAGRRPCLRIRTAARTEGRVFVRWTNCIAGDRPRTLGGLDLAILDRQLAGSTGARASGPSTFPSSSARRPGRHTLGVAHRLAADGTSRARRRAIRPLAPRCAGSGRDVVECVSASRVEAWPRYFRATSLRTYFVPSAVFIRVSFLPLTSVTVALPPASEPPAIPIFTELVPRATSWK
jgi:hypothetical protein